MEIKGSCYCGQVKFAAVSHTPYPYMRCYCSMCRKTAGGGGYAINIMVQADTFIVEGEAHVAVHDNWIDDDEHPGKLKKSSGEGYYCHHCGSALWASDPRLVKKLIRIAISTSYHLSSVSHCLCIVPQMSLRIG